MADKIITSSAEEYTKAAVASPDDVASFAMSDPFALFAEWPTEARKSEPNAANAVALATADTTGTPESARRPRINTG